MADQILPEGIRFFPKHANAPDFVIASMVVTMNDLFEFCKSKPELITEYNGEKQLKLQILKSKNGNLYAKVDTWKPNEAPAPVANNAMAEAKAVEDLGSDLPF